MSQHTPEYIRAELTRLLKYAPPEMRAAVQESVLGTATPLFVVSTAMLFDPRRDGKHATLARFSK